MRSKVAFLLSLTLLTSFLLPFVATFFMLKEGFTTQEQIYRSANLNQLLDEAQKNARELSKLNPDSEKTYKLFFEKVQDLKLIYGEDTYFSERLKSTLSKFFYIGLGAALFISLFLGTYLASHINRIYKNAQDALIKQSERARNLEDAARWQEIAKKLAHEIKRPLQPISTWTQNLRTAFSKKDMEQFESIMVEATEAIEEEVKGLKAMVSEFAKFAELPKPKIQIVNLHNYLQRFVDKYTQVWPRINFRVEVNDKHLNCRLDPTLFQLMLTNLVENADEANPESNIDVILSVKSEPSVIKIDIFNTGKSISNIQIKNIFNPYFTTKTNKKNMGLGLSIVKLAAMEQGGDVQCLTEPKGARFQIHMPYTAGEENAS